MIYEAWGPINGTAHTFSTVGNMIFEKSANLLSDEDVALYSIRAESWEEAMRLYHEAQGWEAYKQMDTLK